MHLKLITTYLRIGLLLFLQCDCYVNVRRSLSSNPVQPAFEKGVKAFLCDIHLVVNRYTDTKMGT